MTYEAKEESQADGQPVEFYEFLIGTDRYTVTSGEDEQTVGAFVYRPIPISRGRISSGPPSSQSPLVVQMPSTESPADLYRALIPGQTCTLTIRRLHRTDGINEVVIIYKGVVKSVVYKEGGQLADLSIVPLTGGLSRSVPRITYQGLCNHVLYDGGCKVVEAGFTFSATATAQVGNVLTVPGVTAEVDGYYNGGFVQLGSTDIRLVLDHVGDDLTLLVPFPASVVGQSVSVVAGCDHTLATCKTKFNNVVNYGGFGFVPLRNIFESGID